jgi:putative hydrolase of the HAD superfamily
VITLNKELIEKHIIALSPISSQLKPSGNLNQPIAGVLFDVYGTLFISASGDIGVAKKREQKLPKIKQLLEKYNINISPENLLQALYGRIEKKHDELRKKGIDFPEIEIENIWMDILETNDRQSIQQFAIEFELIVNPVYPMPHLRELLQALKQQGMLIGIISNAQFFTPYLFDWFLGSDLKHLGFHPNLIFWSFQLKHAKPSSVPFDLAVEQLKRLGIQASSVLYLGNDMLNDIYPATQAGFKTALFAGDKRSLRLREDEPKCANVSPDLVITDLIQLLDFIK